MKHIENVFSKELYKDVFISYAVLQNEDQKTFDFKTDFVYGFGKTKEESNETLKNLLQQDRQIREADFEAFF
jgi:hypothetical protein